MLVALVITCLYTNTIDIGKGYTAAVNPEIGWNVIPHPKQVETFTVSDSQYLGWCVYTAAEKPKPVDIKLHLTLVTGEDTLDINRFAFIGGDRGVLAFTTDQQISGAVLYGECITVPEPAPALRLQSLEYSCSYFQDAYHPNDGNNYC